MSRIVYCIVAMGAMILMTGCGTSVDRDAEKEKLLDVDRAFSSLSVEQGTSAAFAAYAADSAVIYRDGRHPIEGRNAIHELMAGGAGTLTWEPTFADIAESGDLGYTLGMYDYAYTDDAGGERHSYGYYVSIWKKQSDGSWKYVFDSGIEAPQAATSK